MSLFIDTSAIYALLVRSEERHDAVLKAFKKALDNGTALWTTSYVLLETVVLLQNRISLDAVRDFERDIVPLLSIEWIPKIIHERALARLLREDNRDVSLVDMASFEFMKSKGITQAFALDRHFGKAGFEVRP